jgi:FkbM family methyltransferase
MPGCGATLSAPDFFDDLFLVLADFPERQAPTDPMWRVWRSAARTEVQHLFKDGSAVPFGPFGEISFPYHRMGNIDSLDLLGIDELIMFAFYAVNAKRYRRVLDLGANIGLHSIVLARAGFEVRSFEPDPLHFEKLRANLELNGVRTELHRAAVSFQAGRQEFVRVLGNTTGSHLSGAKENPYGDLERFSVEVEDISRHLPWADFAKIDIEGHEAALITHLDPGTWLSVDAMLEVGSTANAQAIFGHLSGGPARMYAQKVGWRPVQRVEDMPTSHRDGSLFLTGKDRMPWGRA